MAEQISPVVSFEVAKKLAPYFPQDSQSILAWWVVEAIDGMLLPDLHMQGGPSIQRDGTAAFWVDSEGRYIHAVEWYAAPTHLQALMFFEQEKGIPWYRNEPDPPFHQGLWRVCIGHPESSIGWAQADDPDSLILAIIAHMETDYAPL